MAPFDWRSWWSFLLFQCTTCCITEPLVLRTWSRGCASASPVRQRWALLTCTATAACTEMSRLEMSCSTTACMPRSVTSGLQWRRVCWSRAWSRTGAAHTHMTFQRTTLVTRLAATLGRDIRWGLAPRVTWRQRCSRCTRHKKGTTSAATCTRLACCSGRSCTRGCPSQSTPACMWRLSLRLLGSARRSTLPLVARSWAISSARAGTRTQHRGPRCPHA
mmetsp:Transcript_24123/g.39888  ORF Transcript_24123/g.39888 Transcript_24123/m.39888 type:complete len:219 (-) Transcript_24123:306-962(-)